MEGAPRATARALGSAPVPLLLACSLTCAPLSFPVQDGEFRPLDMEKTLAENGVADESGEFEELGISEDYYIPVLHLYFNDDLTR